MTTEREHYGKKAVPLDYGALWVADFDSETAGGYTCFVSNLPTMSDPDGMGVIRLGYHDLIGYIDVREVIFRRIAEKLGMVPGEHVDDRIKNAIQAFMADLNDELHERDEDLARLAARNKALLDELKPHRRAAKRKLKRAAEKAEAEAAEAPSDPSD